MCRRASVEWERSRHRSKQLIPENLSDLKVYLYVQLEFTPDFPFVWYLVPEEYLPVPSTEIEKAATP